MVWNISGLNLPDVTVEADSFDEAIAKAREIYPGYASGQPAEYRYGMLHRGFSPGCQPMDGLLRREDAGDRYYDILVYDRPLSEKELRNHELEEIK